MKGELKSPFFLTGAPFLPQQPLPESDLPVLELHFTHSVECFRVKFVNGLWMVWVNEDGEGRKAEEGKA